MSKSMTKEERQWRAESDARTLSAYEDIRQDMTRLREAQAYARKEAKRLQRAADNMGRVAGGKKERDGRKK